MGNSTVARATRPKNQVQYTQFEDVFSAGELLIELFEYFSAFELFTSFYNLNGRLNSIIEQETPLYLNSPLSPKYWKQFIEELLPKVNRYQLKSLTLDQNSLKQQLDLRTFVCSIRVLTLQDTNDLGPIIALLPYFHQLRRLTVLHRFFETSDESSIAQEIQFLAQLPSTLRYLILSETVIVPFAGALVLPGAHLLNIAIAVKHLKLHRTTTAAFLSLIPVFQSALSIKIADVTWVDHQNHTTEISNITVLPKLTNFAVNFDYILRLNFEHLRVILERMPNLKNLSISVLYCKAAFVSDGEQWNRLLQLYCPMWTNFRLKLCPSGIRQNITEEEMQSFKVIGQRIEFQRGSTYPDGSYDFIITAKVVL